jgi:hypothetical protein
MQTIQFWITLLVRALPSGPPSRFTFNSISALEKQGVDVSGDDILRNFTTTKTQMTNRTVPWRGPREHDPLLLQMLIEAASQPGDLVMGCTSTTGNLLASLNLVFYILYRQFSSFMSSR